VGAMTADHLQSSGFAPMFAAAAGQPNLGRFQMGVTKIS